MLMELCNVWIPPPLSTATAMQKTCPLFGHRARAHRRSKKERNLFRLVRLAQVLCILWVTAATFLPRPLGLWNEDRQICPRETICLRDVWSYVFLAISRMSAYGMYPPLVLVFLSKCNSLRTFLQQSWLNELIPFYDLHQLHVSMGTFLLYDGVFGHSFFHLLRWGREGDIGLLFTSTTGVTGLVALILLPLICMPMMVPLLKRRMPWECRKGLHYLALAFNIAIALHAPAMSILWVMLPVLIMYLVDVLYTLLARTFYVETSCFERLDNGVQLTFPNPHEFHHGHAQGYVLVCIPWLSVFQWHPVSVYPHQTDPRYSSVFFNVTGDWTRALHTTVERGTCRPCWIQGPFASPYNMVVEADCLLMVASGTGISLAIAVVVNHQGPRRVNLIWICCDPSLVKFYLSTVQFDPRGWTMIFYTGEGELQVGVIFGVPICRTGPYLFRAILGTKS